MEPETPVTAKECVYDVEIAPLAERILEICESKHMACVLFFAIPGDGSADRYAYGGNVTADAGVVAAFWRGLMKLFRPAGASQFSGKDEASQG